MRRLLLVALMTLAVGGVRAQPAAPVDAVTPPEPPRVSVDEAARRLKEGGWAVLMRHATTVPGTGDPPGFRLDDCATQRNLSQAGRDEAAAAGQALRNRGVRFDEVRASRWCRGLDTARAGFGEPLPWPPLDSFFDDRGTEAARSAAVRAEVQRLQPPRNLLLVTHQVNITALTGVYPAQGEMVAVRWRDGTLRAAFRFQPAGGRP